MSCRHCAWRVEDQRFHWGGYEYSVAAALDILKATPRKPIDLPPGPTYAGLLGTKITDSHVPHVDIRFPSIAVPYRGRPVLIDGNHRAWKRLVQRLPVRAFMLTREERDQIRKRSK